MKRVLIEVFSPPILGWMPFIVRSWDTRKELVPLVAGAVFICCVSTLLSLPYMVLMEVLFRRGVRPDSELSAVISTATCAAVGAGLGVAIQEVLDWKMRDLVSGLASGGAVVGVITSGFVWLQHRGSEAARRIDIAASHAGQDLGGMALFEIKTEIAFASAEVADTLLLEHELENWSVLEDVLVKRAWLVGIFGEEQEAQDSWGVLEMLLKEAGVATATEVVTRSMGDADWRDSYKAHFKAWQFGRLHWVPVWERETFVLPAGDAVLWLDPGLAFGTGNHETTRLCVERLVTLAGTTKANLAAMRVIDAGCGSGILALSAALLGFRAVSGFDNDAEAVKVSEENAALNGLTGRVKFFVGDLVTGFESGPAEVVLANILANVLMQYARELVAAVAPGGTLILSGILAIEVEHVRASFAAVVPAWRMESRIMGEWADVMLVRPE